MSERTHAPRSGGRTADRAMGQGRDADARRSDARGARHFGNADGADTRRSGIGREEPENVRGTRRATDPGAVARGQGRRPEPALGKGRRPEPALGRDRTRGSVEGRDRTTGSIGAGERATNLAGRERRAGAAGGDRSTGPVGRDREIAAVDSRGRTTGMVGRGWNTSVGADKLGADKLGAAVGAGRPAGAGKGRRPVPDAPVDGTAALDVPAAEPIRLAGNGLGGNVRNGPRLRVAPPAPISAPRAPFVASVIAVVVVGVLGILLINTKTNENSFRIADLQKQGAALANQQQDLHNQLVEASSIGNLDAAARRLGLVKAENPALFRLPDGKIIGVLTPTNGRPAVTAQDAKGNKNGGQATGGPAANAGQANRDPAGNGSAVGNGSAAGNGTASNGSASGGTTGNGTADGTGQ